jgi:hypothetical protein
VHFVLMYSTVNLHVLPDSMAGSQLETLYVAIYQVVMIIIVYNTMLGPLRLSLSFME